MLASETKELHGAVSKLGKVGVNVWCGVGVGMRLACGCGWVLASETKELHGAVSKLGKMGGCGRAWMRLSVRVHTTLCYAAPSCSCKKGNASGIQ